MKLSSGCTVGENGNLYSEGEAETSRNVTSGPPIPSFANGSPTISGSRGKVSESGVKGPSDAGEPNGAETLVNPREVWIIAGGPRVRRPGTAADENFGWDFAFRKSPSPLRNSLLAADGAPVVQMDALEWLATGILYVKPMPLPICTTPDGKFRTGSDRLDMSGVLSGRRSFRSLLVVVVERMEKRCSD
ncbi:hypothetical protein DFH07DRAFT_212688 [Mycena maculata]|nr:hypothetical protein DFH07DRAFT_212688 [Mycena maculata]